MKNKNVNYKLHNAKSLENKDEELLIQIKEAPEFEEIKK